MKTTIDDFLGGRLRIEQPAKGYRAGMDPILLAAACSAVAGDTVLDLGCGVGTAALAVAERTGAQAFGVEQNPDLVALAQANGTRNDLPFVAIQGDATSRPTPFSDQSFDHVITNPPFFDPGRGIVSGDATRAAGRSGAFSMEDWIGTAFKRLKPNGRLTVVYAMDRLPDLLSACRQGFGDMRVACLVPYLGKPPNRFILTARKGSKAPFQMLPNVLMHVTGFDGRVSDQYDARIENVLRHGAALTFPD